MLEALLGKGVKLRIVRLFAEGNDDRQVSDVSRSLGISKSRASECLRELERSGILVSKKIGRSVIYRISSTEKARLAVELVYPERRIVEGICGDVVTYLAKLKPLSVVMFGSALKRLKEGSDIDIMAVFKDPDEDAVNGIAAALTEKYGMDVSIISMAVKELREKASRGEEFVLNVIAVHRLLCGKDLEELVWQGK